MAHFERDERPVGVFHGAPFSRSLINFSLPGKTFIGTLPVSFKCVKTLSANFLCTRIIAWSMARVYLVNISGVYYENT